MNCVDSLIDMMGGGQLLENSCSSDYKGMDDNCTDEMLILSKVLQPSNCTSGNEGDILGEGYGYFSSSCSSPYLDTTSSSVSDHVAMHLQAYDQYSYINCEEDYFPDNPVYINHSYNTRTELLGSNPASDFNDPTQYFFTCKTPHKEHMYHKNVCGKAHDLGSNPASDIYDPTQYSLTCENPHKDQYMYYTNVCGKAHDSQLVTELPTSSRSSTGSSSCSIADPFHYILDSAHEYKGDQRAAAAVCTQFPAAAQHTQAANALHTARVKDCGCVGGSNNGYLSDYDHTCKGTSGCNASCRFNCTSMNAANCCSSIEFATNEAQIISSKLCSGLMGGDLSKTEKENAVQNPAARYGFNVYGCADDQYTAAAIGKLLQHAGGAGAAAKGFKAGGDYLHDVNIAAAAMDHQSTAAGNDRPDTNMTTRAAKGDVDDSTHLVNSGTCEAYSYSNIPNWREAMYTRAALQAVDWQDVVTSAADGRPKRRNVRLSAHPQTTSARRRRERISLRIRVLQRLVPGGTHMDTASMLEEAVHYLKFLKAQLQALKCLEKSSLTSLPFATVPTNGFSTFPKDQWSC